MSLTNFIGVAGGLIILISFILNEIHKLDSDSIAYDLANLIGGSLLAFYAYLLSSIPFLVLNTVWSIVAFRDVVIHIKRRNEPQKTIS